MVVVESISTAEKNDRVAIVGCGPDAMVQTLRRKVADYSYIIGKGPSVELILEQFGCESGHRWLCLRKAV